VSTPAVTGTGPWRPAEGVRWAVDATGVVVFRDRGRLNLGYPEAGLWDLVARGTPVAWFTSMMAAIGGWELARAEDWTARTLAGWQRDGWVREGRVRG
jgi:hypothetical protein